MGHEEHVKLSVVNMKNGCSLFSINFLALFTIATLSTACDFLLSDYYRHGDRRNIHSSVVFVDRYGKPFSYKPALVLETIGSGHVITYEMQTDGSGAVRLDGSFCTPVVVSTDIGEVVITQTEKMPMQDSYEVVQYPYPGRERAYGHARPDLSQFKQSDVYKTCGQ